MRILFLTNHLDGTDGWSRVSLDYIGELRNLGVDVLFLTNRGVHPLLAPPLTYLANPLVPFLTALKIKKKIKEFSPDIIHFIVEPYVTILPFLGNIKAKTYLTCHGTYSVIPNLTKNPFKKKIHQFLLKKYFQKLTGIIAVSNYTRNYLLEYYPEIAGKIKVITNGIDLSKIPRPAKRDFGGQAKNEIKKILFVGAVKERKGLLQAVEACRCYRDNFSADFIYDIVGSYDGSHRYCRDLFKKIKEYRLEDKIFFRGKAAPKDLADYYLNADLLMMPSLNINHNFEGFGLVFLEAAARGVPGIGSKDSGCSEAILDGKTGYLVDPQDFKEMARKMDLILNRNSISRKDCLLWSQQNDIKIKAKELINFYKL